MRIGALLDCFTPQECANYIANADTPQREEIML